LIVARDIAHAKIKELLDAGKPMPEYFKTILFIMQVLLKRQKECLQVVLDQQPLVVWMCMLKVSKQGGNMIMLAKGNRTAQVTNACKTYGGFYLGSIGGPAAILAQDNILKVRSWISRNGNGSCS
jgi:fumarate hydratase class I